jgi:predicted phosphodiesterase
VTLHRETLDKAIVMDALDETVHTLQRDDSAIRSKACDNLGIGTAEWESCRDQLIEELQEAEDWAEREQTIVDAVDAVPPVDSQRGPDFIPSHATLALFQSAMNEHLDATSGHGFEPRDPKWLSILYQRLRAQVRGKAPFPQHARAEDFRFTLTDRSTVALVSDWGTGNADAAEVAAQIRRRDPDHVVHLGDVYYSGSPREMRDNFLGMWRTHGPRRARYWTLNGNHDMYSGGYGFFEQVLPAFLQPASYFNLGNRFWRFIALDSAYVNHNFTKPQMAWLEAQLSGSVKTVLLTHHHLFSPFRKRGDKLEEWLDPYLTDGRLFGWVWGHDHCLIEYADYRGIKCRCIGHGSLPHVPPDRLRQTHPAQIVRMDTRSSPHSSSRGMHGFALLTCDGPVLRIEYVDQQGGTAWTEQWK